MASNQEEEEDFSERIPGRFNNDTHRRSEDSPNYDVEHGNDFLEESSEMTSQEAILRPEANFVEQMQFTEVADLLKKLNMDCTGSLEEAKHRLKSVLFSKRQIESISQEMKDQLDTTMQKYKGLKVKLLHCCNQLKSIIQNESFKIEISQSAEKGFPRYEEELQSTRIRLDDMTDKFDIVVTGETSSGKSTFLNVLLGEDILQSHHLHTPTSFCKLHNSENRRINHIVGNSIVTSKPLKADSIELREMLKSVTDQIFSRNTDDKLLETIDVYWPISSLHENVALVDTPGIGEKDALTKQIFEYVPNAAGYIFVIDCGRAGGIQEGGIIKLFEAIGGSASKKDHTKLLENAVFVCNKWDLVPKLEREDVLRDTRKKLCQYFGQLKDWQIVQYDALLEMELLKMKANPTDNFHVLLKSIHTLMITTIHTRLGDKCRWLHKFAMEVNGLINARMVVQSQSKEEVDAKIVKAKEEIRLLNKVLEQRKEVNGMVLEEGKELLQSLRVHLKSADTEKILKNWKGYAPNLGDVDSVGPALIKKRLQAVIFQWATAEPNPFTKASERITEKYKTMKTEIELRLGAIQNLQLGFNLKESLIQTEDLSGGNIVLIFLTSPIWIAFGVFALVLGITTLDTWGFSRLFSSKEFSIAAMTKMTDRVMNKLFVTDALDKFITDSFILPHKELLTKFVVDTKCKRDSTLEIIHELEKDFHLTSDTIRQLSSLQVTLNECCNCLQDLKKDIQIPYLDPYL